VTSISEGFQEGIQRRAPYHAPRHLGEMEFHRGGSSGRRVFEIGVELWPGRRRPQTDLREPSSSSLRVAAAGRRRRRRRRACRRIFRFARAVRPTPSQWRSPHGRRRELAERRGRILAWAGEIRATIRAQVFSAVGVEALEKVFCRDCGARLFSPSTTRSRRGESRISGSPTGSASRAAPSNSTAIANRGCAIWLDLRSRTSVRCSATSAEPQIDRARERSDSHETLRPLIPASDSIG